MPEQPKDSLEIYSGCVCSHNLHFGKKDIFFVKCNWVKNYKLSYIRRSNQSVLSGRTDAEAPILWPPDAKS